MIEIHGPSVGINVNACVTNSGLPQAMQQDRKVKMHESTLSTLARSPRGRHEQGLDERQREMMQLLEQVQSNHMLAVLCCAY